MSQGPVATVNLSAFRHNLSVVRQYAPASKIMAVIKADAYGHGMLQIARALPDVDALSVARVSEGVVLRLSGIQQPIIVLEGFFNVEEIDAAVRYDLQIVIHQARQLEILNHSQQAQTRLKLWLKVDTGMHRLGVDIEDAADTCQKMLELECCQQQPALMTHFANADDVQNTYTREQIASFRKFAAELSAATSLANSAGIIAWPDSHEGWQQNWVRPGIMLYGASPMIGKTASDHGLQPVMTLSSQLFAINFCKQGDCIGYGSSWCCPEDMPVGVVAIGYGDGYPRHAPSGTPILVNGQRTQIIGRVSMDMVTVDLRAIDASEGDEVILWGEGLPAEEVAEAAGTISYELFCGVTSRVNYSYVNND